ncbi:hypothetical protein P9112_013278 [Eukaryota sp. TZLM1-RC]
MDKRETWGYVTSGFLERYLGLHGESLEKDEVYGLVQKIPHHLKQQKFVDKHSDEIENLITIFAVPYTLQLHFCAKKIFSRNPTMKLSNQNAVRGGRAAEGGLALGSMEKTKFPAAGASYALRSYMSIDAGIGYKVHSKKHKRSYGYQERTGRYVAAKEQIFPSDLTVTPINPIIPKMVHGIMFCLGVVLEEF